VKTAKCKLLAVGLLALTALHAPAVLGQSRKSIGATSLEVAQLPKFCWAQMEVPDSIGPGYSIPSAECGYWTNHYCAGLVYLARFKGSVSKSKDLPDLSQADGHIRYTENGIKNYPQCSIRAHVAASRAEVNTLLGKYGKNGSKSAPPRR
jgi:hypothetical protein